MRFEFSERTREHALYVTFCMVILISFLE